LASVELTERLEEETDALWILPIETFVCWFVTVLHDQEDAFAIEMTAQKQVGVLYAEFFY